MLPIIVFTTHTSILLSNYDFFYGKRNYIRCKVFFSFYRIHVINSIPNTIDLIGWWLTLILETLCDDIIILLLVVQLTLFINCNRNGVLFMSSKYSIVFLFKWMFTKLIKSIFHLVNHYNVRIIVPIFFYVTLSSSISKLHFNIRTFCFIVFKFYFYFACVFFCDSCKWIFFSTIFYLLIIFFINRLNLFLHFILLYF